jgi:hypothetical protein
VLLIFEMLDEQLRYPRRVLLDDLGYAPFLRDAN